MFCILSQYLITSFFESGFPSSPYSIFCTSSQTFRSSFVLNLETSVFQFFTYILYHLLEVFVREIP